MTGTIVKRPYHSPLRQAQAEATRTKILDAALGLFARQGYGATSITAIARASGVAPETVYAAFGSKRAIIDALVSVAAPPGMVEGILTTWEAHHGDHRAQLGRMATFAVDFWARNDALAAVFRQGTGETEIGQEWSSRQVARRELFGRLIAAWPASVLRPGLDHPTAADLLWALASDELFQLLVRERDWTPARYREWLAAAMAREVLAPDGRPGSTAD